MTDAQAIIRFAKDRAVDLAFISADEPLAAGVVDALRLSGIPTVGSTREGARLEWDKRYAMELMRDLFPEVTPAFWVAESVEDLSGIFDAIEAAGVEIVVKPQGLTGGKGVKVMGPHLEDYAAARDYAHELLSGRPEECVLLVEKIDGVEFTVMGLTDGERLFLAPTTYDHPYRYAGDLGPGTGGMGAFSGATGRLPFLSENAYQQCKTVMSGVLSQIKAEGRDFNGVLNGGFFATANGIRFMEFNARFGDPEGMNIMCLLETPLDQILQAIAQNRLHAADYRKMASVTKYLVSPDYALRPGKTRRFTVDVEAIESLGVHVFFSSALKVGENTYETVGNSRCVALGACADSVHNASSMIEEAIEAHLRGPLEWRRDIGDGQYIETLSKRCG